MYYRLRAAWWKIHPPKILSPFLHAPKFAKGLEATLAACAPRANRPVEIGCLYGWTTNIIAQRLRYGVRLLSIDTFTRATVEEVQANLGPNAAKVDFQYGNLWHWLDGGPDLKFDFLYVDANNTESTFIELWKRTRRDIAHGAIVLVEGATRMRLNIPMKVVVPENPGLGQLLP